VSLTVSFILLQPSATFKRSFCVCLSGSLLGRYSFNFACYGPRIYLRTLLHSPCTLHAAFLAARTAAGVWRAGLRLLRLADALPSRAAAFQRGGVPALIRWAYLCVLRDVACQRHSLSPFYSPHSCWRALNFWLLPLRHSPGGGATVFSSRSPLFHPSLQTFRSAVTAATLPAACRAQYACHCLLYHWLLPLLDDGTCRQRHVLLYASGITWRAKEGRDGGDLYLFCILDLAVRERCRTQTRCCGGFCTPVGLWIWLFWPAPPVPHTCCHQPARCLPFYYRTGCYYLYYRRVSHLRRVTPGTFCRYLRITLPASTTVPVRRTTAAGVLLRARAAGSGCRARRGRKAGGAAFPGMRASGSPVQEKRLSTLRGSRLFASPDERRSTSFSCIWYGTSGRTSSLLRQRKDVNDVSAVEQGVVERTAIMLGCSNSAWICG